MCCVVVMVRARPSSAPNRTRFVLPSSIPSDCGRVSASVAERHVPPGPSAPHRAPGHPVMLLALPRFETPGALGALRPWDPETACCTKSQRSDRVRKPCSPLPLPKGPVAFWNGSALGLGPAGLLLSFHPQRGPARLVASSHPAGARLKRDDPGPTSCWRFLHLVHLLMAHLAVVERPAMYEQSRYVSIGSRVYVRGRHAAPTTPLDPHLSAFCHVEKHAQS